MTRKLDSLQRTAKSAMWVGPIIVSLIGILLLISAYVLELPLALTIAIMLVAGLSVSLTARYRHDTAAAELDKATLQLEELKNDNAPIANTLGLEEACVEAFRIWCSQIDTVQNQGDKAITSLSDNFVDIVQRLQQAVDISEANLGSGNPKNSKTDDSVKTL